MKGVSAFPSENSAGIDLFTYMVAHAPPRPHEAVFSPKPECQCEPEPPSGCAPCVQALMQYGENSEQFQQRAVDQKELAKKYVAQIMAIRDANVAALAVWSAQQSAQWAVTWALAVKMAISDPPSGEVVVAGDIPEEVAEEIAKDWKESYEEPAEESKAPEPEPLVPPADA